MRGGPFQIKNMWPPIHMFQKKKKRQNKTKERYERGGFEEGEVLKVGSVAYLLTLWAASNAEWGGDPTHLVCYYRQS